MDPKKRQALENKLITSDSQNNDRFGCNKGSLSHSCIWRPCKTTLYSFCIRPVHSPQKCPLLFTLVLDVFDYQKTFNWAHVGPSVMSRTFRGVLVDFQCKLQCKKCHIWFFQFCGKNSKLLDFLQSPMNSGQSEYAI